jgi:type II restriction enzyme
MNGNKGDWSEIYALLKLLGDKKVYAGDANLNRIESLFYPIIKIIREESGGNFEYQIDGDIILISGDKETLRVPVKTFSEEATKLLMVIKEANGVFSIPETEAFMNSIYCKSLKGNSNTKTDIRVVIHDQVINQSADLGFSIKSQLGSNSTLLNAGKTTNFIFKVNSIKFSESDIQRINSIDGKRKIMDRLVQIEKEGGSFSFQTLEQNIFKNNLVLIDSLLPNILSEMVFLFYTSPLNSIKALCEEIDKQNPLNYDNQFSHDYYNYKIKRFLTDVALGMMPSKVWSGKYDATGGYLIVKSDGEVLCYHVYNRNQFEDYLFDNTKLETASSSRHEFGELYTINGEFYFKLNLQIRFIS